MAKTKKGKPKSTTKKQIKSSTKQTNRSKGNTLTQSGSRKRPASDGSDDDPDSSDTDHLRRARKRKRAEPELVEIEDSDTPEPEEVSVIRSDEDSSDEVRQGLHPTLNRILHTLRQDASDLEDRHIAEIPENLNVKKERAKDLLTIFSDLVTVKFKHAGDEDETVKGRWCLQCK